MSPAEAGSRRAGDDARRALVVSLLALSITLFTSLSARAAEPEQPSSDPTAQAAARVLFEEARVLLAAERYAEACPKLAESFRLNAGAGTEINLGHCLEKSGQIASAWSTFKDAAATARRGDRPDWAVRAEQRAELLAPKLPMITIRVPAPSIVDGMVVTRDGAPIDPSTWDSAIPVNPGVHRIEVTAPSRVAFVQEVDIAVAERVTIDVPLLERPPAPAPAPAPPPPLEAERMPAQKIAGVAMAAAGVVALGVGTALGVMAIAKNRDVASKCPALACPDEAVVSESKSARALGNASTIALVVGGGLASVGGILFFLGPSHATPAVRVNATAFPGAGSISVFGVF